MNAHSSSKSFEILAQRLQEKTGQTLLPNRHWRIESVLQPIMREHAIPDIDALVSVLSADSSGKLEMDCMEATLNNETCFFRDQANFALLTGPVLDKVRESRENIKKLRIWSSACSFGQEAISLAIAVAENRQKWVGWDIEIIATDVSQYALKRAKKGLYNQFEVQRGLPIGLLLKYFQQIDQDWQVNQDILDMVKYRPNNMVLDDIYLGQFDLVLCRNMMMYLGEENKAKAFQNIEKAMTPNAYLMLGSSETLIGQDGTIEACSDFRGFYKKA